MVGFKRYLGGYKLKKITRNQKIAISNAEKFYTSEKVSSFNDKNFIALEEDGTGLAIIKKASLAKGKIVIPVKVFKSYWNK